MLKLDDLDMEFYKNGVEELNVHEKKNHNTKKYKHCNFLCKTKPIKQIVNIIHENIIYFF